MDRAVNGLRKGWCMVAKRKVCPFLDSNSGFALLPSHVRHAYRFLRDLPSSETGVRDICFVYYQTQVERVYKERLDVFLLFSVHG